MPRDMLTEREKARKALQIEGIRAVAPIVLELARGLSNVTTSLAQSAATNPMAAGTMGVLAGAVGQKTGLIDPNMAKLLQVASLGYTGLAVGAEAGQTFASLLESIPLSGDAPSTSQATSISFDLADNPPGINPGPNAFLEEFLAQRKGKK